MAVESYRLENQSVAQTFDPLPESAIEPEQPAGNSVGCYIYGCLGVVAFMIVLALCSGFGLYYFVTGQIEKYTSTEATELPSVEYSEEQLAELHQRIDSFRQSVEGEASSVDGQNIDATAAEETPTDETTDNAELPPVRELVLTAEEINALIGENESLRNRVFISIDEGEITGEISIPTEDFLPASTGRFFNASATFEVTLEEGVLIVTLSKAEVKGEQVPETIMQEIRKENLAKDLYKDPKNARMIGRFESISIEDDRIVAKLREQ